MLGALDRKPVPRVVMSHLRDSHETALEITEAEFATLRVAADFHVHETSSTPKMKGKKELVKCSQNQVLNTRFLHVLFCSQFTRLELPAERRN